MGNGFPGRFADGTISGKRHLDDLWCCINPSVLRDAATMFAGLTILEIAELEEPGPKISPV